MTDLLEIVLPEDTAGIRLFVVSWPVGLEHWCDAMKVLARLRQPEDRVLGAS